MKIAPLALAIHVYESFGGRQFDQRSPYATAKYTELLWRLTHSHVDALHTAYVIAATIGWCLVHPITNEQDARQCISWLKEEMREVRNIANWGNPTETLLELQHIDECLGDADALAVNRQPGWLAIDSVPYALGIFLSFPTDGRIALLTCVNSGIDSDTTAAICGSLIGANCGFAGFPLEWRNFRPDFQEAIGIGTQLYATFSK